MEPEGSLPCSQEPATCPYPEPNESTSTSPNPISLRSILMLSSHLRLGLRSGLLPSGLPTKNKLKHTLKKVFSSCFYSTWKKKCDEKSLKLTAIQHKKSRIYSTRVSLRHNLRTPVEKQCVTQCMTLTTTSFNQLCHVVTESKFTMRNIFVLTAAQGLLNHSV
jgi:hypothetical protein